MKSNSQAGLASWAGAIVPFNAQPQVEVEPESEEDAA